MRTGLVEGSGGAGGAAGLTATRVGCVSGSGFGSGFGSGSGAGMGSGSGSGYLRGGQLGMLYRHYGVSAGDADHLQRCDYLEERHFL